MWEQTCRWIGALPVLHKRSRYPLGPKSVANMIRRIGLRKFIFTPDQEVRRSRPTSSRAKWWVAELGDSYDIIVEGGEVNEHQSNGVVGRALQRLGVMLRTRKVSPGRSHQKDIEAGNAGACMRQRWCRYSRSSDRCCLSSERVCLASR